MVSEASESDSKRGGEDCSTPFKKSYRDVFNECFPFYLAIGMTPEQYWDGDPSLVRAYRKADEIRKNRMNEQMWLQGMYIYEALCDASPLYHDLAKRGTKARPYSDKPYCLTPEQKEKREENHEKEVYDKGKAHMMQMMEIINARFAKQAEKGDDNGNGS